MKKRSLYNRDEMLKMNIDTLKERGVSLDEIAEVAYQQQAKWTRDISRKDCLDSVEKILSLRDTFHLLQLGCEIDRLTEENLIREPLREILHSDLGMFGIDELFGLEIAGLYGTIGRTNFGDIDVNKPLIVGQLNHDGKGKKPKCHTFLDDIVGAIAAAASTRVAQITNENEALKQPGYVPLQFDFEEE